MLKCRKYKFYLLFLIVIAKNVFCFSIPFNKNQEGCFNNPSDVYIDKQNRIFVADQLGNTIQVYNIRENSWKIIGREGYKVNEFYYPSSVCSYTDVLFVCDMRNNRLQIIEPFNTLVINKFNNVNFDSPQKIAVDKNGGVYISFPYLPEIVYFNKDSGKSLLNNKNGLGFPVSLRCFDSKNHKRSKLLICDQAKKHVIVHRTDTGKNTFIPFRNNLYDACFINENEFLVSCGEQIFLIDGNKNNLKVWNTNEIFDSGCEGGSLYAEKNENNTYSVVAIIKKENRVVLNHYDPFDKKFLSSGIEISRSKESICEPFALSFDDIGNIYICDSANNRIKVYTSKLEVKEIWDDFSYPQGIAIYKDRAFVSDTRKHQIVVLDLNGNPLDYIITGNYGNLRAPRNIIVDVQKENLIICDSGNDRILIFDLKTHEFLKEIGSSGHQEGQFAGVSDVAKLNNGNYLVVDYDNHRLQLFDGKWNFKKVIGKYGKGEGEFACPNSVATDYLGNIYITDEYNSRVQVFDKEFNYVKSINGFYTPMAIRMYKKNSVLVADSSYGNVWYLTIDTTCLNIFNNEVKYINK